MSRSMRDRVSHLTVVTANKNFFAKTCFVEWISVCCSEHEYTEHTPSDCGFIGFITIRAASRERYNARKAELRRDGWTLLEG